MSVGVNTEHPPLGSEFLQMLGEIVDNDNKKMGNECVAVAPIAFWTQLFANYFLHVNNPHHDDLLFYVKKDPASHDDKAEVKVFRRESSRSPGLGDPSYDWTETVYLNLILQQLQYRLTCAICTKRKDGEVTVHKKVSQTVFASPNRHDMDAKGHSAELSYPNIFFPIDSFDEIWTELHLNPGEMVCVEIVAHDKAMQFCSVIFLGSVNYEALMKVYEKKTVGLGSANKWASFMTIGLYKGPSEIQFVKMKGPGGKGYAEMAVEAHKEKASSDEGGSSNITSLVNSRSEPESLYKHTLVAKPATSSAAAYQRTDSESSSSLPVTPTIWRMPTQSSLKTQLTYVTLPWHKIVLDVLKAYENPAESKKPVLGTC